MIRNIAKWWTHYGNMWFVWSVIFAFVKVEIKISLIVAIVYISFAYQIFIFG